MSRISEWMKHKSHNLAEELVDINARHLLVDNISGFGMKGRVIELLTHLKTALFPSLYEKELVNADYLSAKVMDKLNSAAMLLNAIVRDVLINKCELEKKENCGGKECFSHADEITATFMERILGIRQMLTLDIAAAYEGDPQPKTWRRFC